MCILLRLAVAGISYVDIEKILKTEKCQVFRKTPFWVFAYHVGLTVTTFSVAHVGVPGVLIRYVAFATVTMWAGLPEPRDCGVLSIVLCVLRGLEPSLSLFLAILSQGIQRPHYYLVTLLSWLHNVLPVASRPIRLLTRYLLHLSYDWSLCLAQLTPAYGVTSFPFRPGCHRLSCHQHSVALLPLLAMGTRHSLLLTVFFLPRSLNRCASACHSSINRLSGLRPVF